ncbi:tumor protein p53-inducible nuclear protein 2 isoform X1 [Oryzias latipes]
MCDVAVARAGCCDLIGQEAVTSGLRRPPPPLSEVNNFSIAAHSGNKTTRSGSTVRTSAGPGERRDCDRSVEMIGRILFNLLGGAGDDPADDCCHHLTEVEDEGWVLVNLPENVGASASGTDSLENLLIEHPSMSVYQRRCGEEELTTDEEEEEEDPSRPVTVARRPSWHLAGGGILLAWSEPPLAVRRSWSPAERKKLSRGALHRHNLARVRFSVGARRYGHFKQPCQRLYNY